MIIITFFAVFSSESVEPPGWPLEESKVDRIYILSQSTSPSGPKLRRLRGKRDDIERWAQHHWRTVQDSTECSAAQSGTVQSNAAAGLHKKQSEDRIVMSP